MCLPVPAGGGGRSAEVNSRRGAGNPSLPGFAWRRSGGRAAGSACRSGLAFGAGGGADGGGELRGGLGAGRGAACEGGGVAWRGYCPVLRATTSETLRPPCVSIERRRLFALRPEGSPGTSGLLAEGPVPEALWSSGTESPFALLVMTASSGCTTSTGVPYRGSPAASILHCLIATTATFVIVRISAVRDDTMPSHFYAKLTFRSAPPRSGEESVVLGQVVPDAVLRTVRTTRTVPYRRYATRLRPARFAA